MKLQTFKLACSKIFSESFEMKFFGHKETFIYDTLTQCFWLSVKIFKATKNFFDAILRNFAFKHHVAFVEIINSKLPQ